MNSTAQMEDGNPSGWQNYIKIGIRRRWWLIISAVIFWAAALAVSVILPPKFKSETLVLIEPGDVPAQYVTSNIDLDLQQRLQSLTEQTLSRPRLAQVIAEFHLYGNMPGQIAGENQVEAMRRDIAVEVTKANGKGEISAFNIAYSGSTPEQAQKVTTRLASLFIRDSLDRQQRASENTTSFLEGQLQDALKELQKEENALRDARSRNLGELPEQRTANVQILSGVQDRLRSSTESLHQAEKQRLYLGSLLGLSATAKAGSAARDEQAASSGPLDEQIEKMKGDLASLSARYMPRHPDIVHLKEQIASAERLKSELERDGQSGKGTNAAGNHDMSPSQHSISAIGELQSQYKANEMEISSRKQEIKDLEKQLAQYQARLNLAPGKEQEVTEATRNYEQARTHYESLLAKKQQSEMATDLSKTQTTAQFRTLDPPSLPQKPYWPNRLKFSGIGFMLGMLIGFLMIAIKETVDARIYGEDDLSRWVSVPVMATVPPLLTNAEKQTQTRRYSVEIAIASLVLVLIPALTIVAYLKG